MLSNGCLFTIPYFLLFLNLAQWGFKNNWWGNLSLFAKPRVLGVSLYFTRWREFHTRCCSTCNRHFFAGWFSNMYTCILPLRRLHMSEKFSSGTINPKVTNKPLQITSFVTSLRKKTGHYIHCIFKMDQYSNFYKPIQVHLISLNLFKYITIKIQENKACFIANQN